MELHAGAYTEGFWGGCEIDHKLAGSFCYSVHLIPSSSKFTGGWSGDCQVRCPRYFPWRGEAGTILYSYSAVLYVSFAGKLA